MTAAAYSPIRAIGFKILHLFLTAAMLALVKLVQGMPVTQLMFFRSLLAILPIIAVLAMRRQLRDAIRTRRPFGHFTRALLSLTTMGLTFLAVRSLPLPEAVTLQYTQPLFVVALSALILGETVRLFRWAAVGFGFLGVLVVTWPKLTLLGGGTEAASDAELIGAGAALTAAATLALTLLLVGQLVRTEKSTTIAIWLGIYASAILAFTIPFGWVVPDARQTIILAMIGVIGGLSQLALTESLRSAPASTTAPFEYTSLIFATAFGFAVFGDIPDGSTIYGGAILAAAGLAIIWRERKNMIRPITARSTGLPPE
ncbi:DMT family transporter [Poseidonocella sp. HB161398]|uniref:DMT family transporter n=1 Tax=Poseidonocella sp. HB161398 TaxID=2320855 RepID=UPI0011098042|nr:DMT family transporter [Poseidonocella sp. HB161398]